MSQEMNLPEASAPETYVEAQPTSGFRGLIAVIASPANYFSKVKQSPTILVPYLAVVIITLVAMLIISPVAVKTALSMPDVQEKLGQSAMTPAQQATAIRISAIAVPTLAATVAPLLIAALALFWGNFVFAGRARFSQVLSVVLWGEFIFALGVLAVVPLMLAKGSVVASYSLAAFVANLGPQSFWYVLLSKISVFHIWELIVIGIGLSIVYEFPRNKGMWLSVLSMGLLSILHVAAAGIGTLFK